MYVRSAVNDEDEEDFDEVDVEWDDGTQLTFQFLDHHTHKSLQLCAHM